MKDKESSKERQERLEWFRRRVRLNTYEGVVSWQELEKDVLDGIEEIVLRCHVRAVGSVTERSDARPQLDTEVTPTDKKERRKLRKAANEHSEKETAAFRYTSGVEDLVYEAFLRGAEWQAKQSSMETKK